MSPDPRPADEGTGPAAPRTGSGLLARLLTVAYALLVAPVATGLLAYGGSAWYRIIMTRGYLDSSMLEALAGPMGVQIIGGIGLGLVLLASVVATGIASSAGLLAVGVLGLLSLVLSAVPGLLFQVYRIAPSVIPPEALDGLAYGLPLVLHTVMGGLGMALVLARRRPDPSLAVSLAGLLVVPAVLLLGGGLQLGGIGHGLALAMRTFNTEVSLLAVALILAGSLLLWLGAAASRWSPYALVIPALALLVATVPLAIPHLIPPPPGIWSSPASASAASFLMLGGGIAAATVLLVHTAVLAIVRRRARSRLRAAAAPVPPSAEGPSGTEPAAAG